LIMNISRTTRPDWLQYPDHTADECVRVTGASLAEVFERAAWGMVSLIYDPETVSPAAAETVKVEADDREALLVRWLSEINRLHQVHHRMYGRFTVKSISDTALDGEVASEAIDKRRHAVFGEIKAVTFHWLKIEERDGVWVAQVLFDV
jgi:SHS2 domain-containing protein